MSCQEVPLGTRPSPRSAPTKARWAGHVIYAEQMRRFPAAPNASSRPSAQCLWSNEPPMTGPPVWSPAGAVALGPFGPAWLPEGDLVEVGRVRPQAPDLHAPPQPPGRVGEPAGISGVAGPLRAKPISRQPQDALAGVGPAPPALPLPPSRDGEPQDPLRFGAVVVVGHRVSSPGSKGHLVRAQRL
jgi:hypothetical protein